MRYRFLALAALTVMGSIFSFASRELSQIKVTDASNEMRPKAAAKTLREPKLNGLLLGTHWTSEEGCFGEVKAGDRTWWIVEVDGKIQVREIPNILFPRKEGFWTAGTKEIQDDKSFERYVWTAPLGKTSKSAEPDLSYPKGCSDQTTARDMLFIGTDYVAIREFGMATCVNYGESTAFYVTTPEDPNRLDHSENGPKISDVLGATGLDAFNKALPKGDAESEDLHCGKLFDRPDNWAILREKGRWVVKGNGSYGGHVCDGYFVTEFDVKMRLPKSVVGYDELAIG